MKDKQTNIYFIKSKNFIKIGVAENVKKRMVELQVGSPHELKILYSFNVLTDEAYKIENAIHNIFRLTRMNGEWYQETRSLKEFMWNIKKIGWNIHLEWISKHCKIENKYGVVNHEKPTNLGITSILRKWIVSDERIFTTQELYHYFNFNTRETKRNARVAIHRFCSEEKIIKRIGNGLYSSIRDSCSTL